MTRWVFALLLLAPSSLLAADASKPTLAVLNMRDAGAGEKTVQSVTDILTAELSELGVFEVLSKEDLKAVLSFEAQKQVLGCSDTDCLAEISGALGVANLVSGSVGKVAEEYILSLRLTDRLGNELARESRRGIALEDLTREVEGAGRFLVRSLLEGMQGELVVRVSESGADIELDGKLIGVSPLGKLALPGGPHRVRVSKKGFITWSRDVTVDAEQALVVDASLVPSLEFIEDYESKAGRWRTWAWISGGVGVAALAFGGYNYLVYNAQRADEYNADVRAAGCARDGVSAPTVDCTAEFQSRRDSIEQLDTISVASMALGVVALGVGVYLYTAGPEPGAYDIYNPTLTAPATVGIAPSPDGGWMSSATLRF